MPRMVSKVVFHAQSEAASLNLEFPSQTQHIFDVQNKTALLANVNPRHVKAAIMIWPHNNIPRQEFAITQAGTKHFGREENCTY